MGSHHMGIARLLLASLDDSFSHLCEGSGVRNLFALCSDIKLVLPIGQVSILLGALAGLEHCCGVLLVPGGQRTLEADAARTTAGCAKGE